MAGSILESSLVYTGWKFPHISLSLEDQKLLLDVEIKIKLHHMDAIRQLREIVIDFPGQSLLQYPSLVRTMLDELGSNCFLPENFRTNSYCVSLIEIAEKIILSCGESAKLLSHDSKWYSCRSMVASDDKIGNMDNCDQALSTIPVPSFSGFAFACCAAVLPLVKIQDIEVTMAVKKLFSTCWRFGLESEGNLQLNAGRIQHILNRFNQLFLAVSPFSSFRLLWSLSSQTYDIFDSISTWEACYANISNSFTTLLLIDIFNCFTSVLSSNKLRNECVVGQGIQQFFQSFLVHSNSISCFCWSPVENLSTFINMKCPVISNSILCSKNIANMLRRLRDFDVNKYSIGLETWELVADNINFFYSTSLFEVKSYLDVDNFAQAIIFNHTIAFRNDTKLTVGSVNSLMDIVRALFFYGQHDIKIALIHCISSRILSDRALPDELIATLCSIPFAQYLCFTILQKEVFPAGAKEVDSMLCVLSFCCKTQNWSPDEWEMVLQWITTVCWRWREYSDHARYVDGFLDKTSEASLQCQPIPAAWINRLVQGIFHTDCKVQTKSIELLSRMILKKRFLFNLQYEKFDMNVLPEYNFTVRTPVVHTSKKKTLSVTHSDLRNLASSAFGSSSYAVKCAAISQLLDNLLADDCLLLTCDIKWICDICKKLVESVECEVFGKDQLTTCIHEYDKFRSEFCLNGIRLLSLFAISHKNLEFAVLPVKDSQSDMNVVDISILLFLVIGTNQLRSQFNKICEGSKFVIIAFNESVRVLHALFYGATKWNISLGEGNVSYAEQNLSEYGMPEFLRLDYCCGTKFKSESGDINQSLNFSKLVEPIIQFPMLSPLPSSTIVDAAVKDIEISGSLRSLIAHRLSSLLISAGDHWSFYRASTVLVMYLKLYNSAHDFVGDILGTVVQVIQKMFEKIPTTQKDRCVFLVALKLSRSLLPFCTVSLQNSILNSVIPSMVSVLEQLQLNNGCCDEVNSSWSFDIAMIFIKLIIESPVPLIQHMQRNSNMCGKMFDIFLKESKNSELKLLASQFIEMLLNLNITQFPSICGIVTSKDDIVSLDLVPLKLIINVAKLLRVPDSFQLQSITISALKLVLIYLEHFENLGKASALWESLHWQWLSRLFYHRSAEIRLLSLETAHRFISLVERVSNISAPSNDWPPVQQLYYLLVDDSEIQIVRIKSGVILLQLSFLSQIALPWPNDHVISKFSEVVYSGCTSVYTLLEMIEGVVCVVKCAGFDTESTLLRSCVMACIQKLLNIFVNIHLQNLLSGSDVEKQLLFVIHCKLFKLLLSTRIDENQFGLLISEKGFVIYCQYILQEHIFSEYVNLTSDFAIFEGISNLVVNYLNNQEYWFTYSNNLLSILNSIVECIRRGLKCLVNGLGSELLTGKVLQHIESCCCVLFVVIQAFSFNSSAPNQSDSLLSTFLSLRQLWSQFMLEESFEGSVVIAKIEILLSLMIEYDLVEENALVRENVDFIDTYTNRLRKATLWGSCKDVTKSEGGKILRNSRWRRKVRSFVVAEECNSNRYHETSEEAIKFCWSSMLLLKSATSTILLSANREQQKEVMVFIQNAVIFAVENCYRVTMQQTVGGDQMSAVIWSCFCNVIVNDWTKEQFFSISSPAIIRRVNSDGSNSEKLIHQMLSLSFHDGVIDAIRWLLLDACSKCLLSDQIISPSIKLTAYQNIANALQNSLLGSAIQHDVFHLLSACTVVISANPEILSNTVRHSIKHSKCPSFQELLEWVHDKSCKSFDRIELIALIIRGLGLPIWSVSSTFKSFVVQSFSMNVANLAVCSDSAILKLLGSIYIWYLLQLSEKNKHVVKKQLENIHPLEYTENVSSVLMKAQFNINVLLNG